MATDQHAAIRLSMLHQLDETQWWPAEKIEQYQFLQIKELLRHAVKNVKQLKLATRSMVKSIHLCT